MLVKGKRCQPLIKPEGLLERTWSAGERQSGRDDKEGEEGNVRHLQEGNISLSQKLNLANNAPSVLSEAEYQLSKLWPSLGHHALSMRP